MLTNIQLKDIKQHLENGQEVEITCTSLKRQVELERQTFDFPGVIRIKLIESRAK